MKNTVLCLRVGINGFFMFMKWSFVGHKNPSMSSDRSNTQRSCQFNLSMSGGKRNFFLLGASKVAPHGVLLASLIFCYKLCCKPAICMQSEMLLTSYEICMGLKPLNQRLSSNRGEFALLHIHPEETYCK